MRWNDLSLLSLSPLLTGMEDMRNSHPSNGMDSSSIFTSGLPGMRILLAEANMSSID